MAYRTGDAEKPAPPEGFGVVITGATKGVGYALAREFLARGDRVCICGRSATRVDAAVAALRAEFPGACVAGARCDVTDPRDVDAFGDYAASTVGVVHHWLNNAGMVSSREPLFDVEPAEVVRVCNTNLTGAVLCCQKAIRLMRRQDEGSDGGSRRREPNGGASPQRYHVERVILIVHFVRVRVGRGVGSALPHAYARMRCRTWLICTCRCDVRCVVATQRGCALAD